MPAWRSHQRGLPRWAGALAIYQQLAERHGLSDCLMWGNDYPHHEGTWPHSAEAIERTMGTLNDEQRAKALGLNAARLFKFDVPPRAA